MFWGGGNYRHFLLMMVVIQRCLYSFVALFIRKLYKKCSCTYECINFNVFKFFLLFHSISFRCLEYARNSKMKTK